MKTMKIVLVGVLLFVNLIILSQADGTLAIDNKELFTSYECFKSQDIPKAIV